ncbi:MAG: di-trans,poly-cis-decaprenylcistransferase [Candidatus Aenigmarchaeota archaeon]|nr:di-trans,poly-cis-decaprenylcistransferase [Candidatus Aenigmarchaeota archaeon]
MFEMQTLNSSKRSGYSTIEAPLNHLGIIMDGNRRFAQKLMLQPWKGHEWGEKKVEEVLDWCKEFGIKTVTFYTLSLENIAGRPKTELDYLYKLMERVGNEVLKNKKHAVHKNRMRVRIIGRTSFVPPKLQKLLAKIESVTKNYENYEANFAIAYSSRVEIIDAVRKIAKLAKSGKIDAAKIDESVIKENLYNPDMTDPDLIIRTGGEKRLSNFLMFQSAYSELFFTDTPWPEFSKSDFVAAINDFNQRKRRFGA